jgi:hypothetical protein
VCASSQQALIDHRLLRGESLATLSADYGLPVRELRHHKALVADAQVSR